LLHYRWKKTTIDTSMQQVAEIFCAHEKALYLWTAQSDDVNHKCWKQTY
jgi:hypothetical protein